MFSVARNFNFSHIVLYTYFHAVTVAANYAAGDTVRQPVFVNSCGKISSREP